MTSQQFDAVAKLIRMRQGRAEQAAYWVLVDGHPPGEVAALTGLSPSSVSNAVSRMCRGLALALVAAA